MMYVGLVDRNTIACTHIILSFLLFNHHYKQITMFNINITDEQLQTSADAVITRLMKPDEYNNPVKKIIEEAFSSYNKEDEYVEFRKKFKTHVLATVENIITSPLWATMLGQAFATEMAKAALKEKTPR